jgi:hypothetical protein
MITQSDIDQHNTRVIARIVAQQIWAQTSRMDTSTKSQRWG